MKKYISALLAFVLLLSIPGCSTGDEEADPTPTGFFEIPAEDGSTSFEINLAYAADMDQIFVAARLLEEGHYIGCTLILPDHPKGDIYLSGTVIMSEYFPKIDGEYQNITREDLNNTIAAAMQERGLCYEKESVEFFPFSTAPI